MRFDGRIPGAFVGRWSLGAQLDAQLATALLAIDATVAAPPWPPQCIVISRRSVWWSTTLLGISQAMREVRRSIESAAAAP